MAHLDLIDPVFVQKKMVLSRSHLVPKILGPEVCQIFHQNVLSNSFLNKDIVSIFILIFNLDDPFFIGLKIFLTPNFYG